MFMKTQYRRLIIFFIGLTLGLAASALAQKSKQSEKGKEVESIPAGKPILWTEPGNIRSRDLYWGQGGKEMQPDLSRVTLIRKETGGYSIKYRVRDGSGRVWVAKLGKEAKGETAAVRLMWAVGYYSDINYLVPSVRVEGLNKPLTNVRFGLRPDNIKRIDGWQWDRNPFVGTRQFQGLKVMMALLNNWDIKDSNNKVLVPKHDASDEKELHYMVADLGGSFGKVSHIPRFLYFKPDRNNPKAYVKTRLVDKVRNGRVDFHFKLRRSSLFKNITVEDVDWVTAWLARLSDRQIQDAFRAANYSPDEIRMMTQGVRNRIRELIAVRESMTARRH